MHPVENDFRGSVPPCHNIASHLHLCMSRQSKVQYLWLCVWISVQERKRDKSLAQETFIQPQNHPAMQLCTICQLPLTHSFHQQQGCLASDPSEEVS